MKNPCFRCKKRVIACHSVCFEYKEFKTKLDSARETKEKTNLISFAFLSRSNGYCRAGSSSNPSLQ